jgi:hypothetical protein
MTSLIKLFNSIAKNYDDFEKKGNIEALKKIIRGYEAIPSETRVRELSCASVSILEKCSETLLLMGKVYTNYAFAQKDLLTEHEINTCLAKANRCYALVVKYIGKCPPFTVSLPLGQLSTEAKFYIHKMKFYHAQMSFFSIKKKMQGDYDFSAVMRELRHVRKQFLVFQTLLLNGYKAKEFCIRYALTPEFHASIKDDLAEIQRLLVESDERHSSIPLLGKRKSNSELDAEELQQAQNKDQQKKRRLIEESSDSSEESANTSDERTLSPEFEPPLIINNGTKDMETEAATPLRQSFSKFETLILESERLLTASDESSDFPRGLTDAFNEDNESVPFPDLAAAEFVIKAKEKQIESSTLLMQSLATLETLANETNRNSQPSLASPIITGTYSFIPVSQVSQAFWAKISSFERDSEQAWRLIQTWQKAYCDNHQLTSAAEEKALIFQKLGHSLLVATCRGRCSEDAPLYNPLPIAARLGIKFLAKSAELSCNRGNPMDIIYELSEIYQELLVQFIDPQNLSSLASCKYLSHLGKKVRVEGDLIYLNNISAEGAVQKIFSTLAKSYPQADYTVIKKEFFASFEAAAMRLSQSKP